MPATPTIVVQPTSEPVTLAEARRQLRLADDETLEDDDILESIASARELAEHETNRRILPLTLEWKLDAFPRGDEGIKLHTALFPVRSVSLITYLDANGDTQTLSADAYVLDANNEMGYIIPAAGYSWPTTFDGANAVTLRVVSGSYETVDDVPANIKKWIRFQVGAMDENRSAIALGRAPAELPGRFVDRLLDPYRVYW